MLVSGKHSMARQVRRRSPRNVSVRASAATSPAAAATGRKTKVSFALPYRCHFGQQICLVGKGSVLGDWSVTRAVEMNWTEGDVWVADVDITDSLMKELEYKYVVRDSSGQVNRWMDGNNVVVQIPSFLSNGRRSGTISVNDSWDHSSHNVSVSFEGIPQPREVEIEFQRLSDLASSSGRSQSEPKAADPAPVYDEMMVLQSSIEKALNDLSTAMEQSKDVVDGEKDPAHPDALLMDRKVAASYNRVMALSRALKASNTDLRLPQPPRCYGQRPAMSWRFDRVPAWVR